MKINMLNLPEQIRLLHIDNDMHKVIQHIAKHDDEKESYYICDIGDIVTKYRTWQQHFPRIRSYYSVKCNNNIVVLELMAVLGARFDCASKDEIRTVLSLGVSPEHIVFANPAKLYSHIRYAATVGVDLLTVDHEIELYKIKRLHPRAKLLVRIKANSSQAVRTFDEKFGCEMDSDGMLLINIAQSLGLEVAGITFHVGSGCLEYEAYRRAIVNAKNLFAYGAKLGYKFNILNIGGGFPGNLGAAFTELAETVNSALEEYFPDATSVAIDAEIGRFYATSAFTLVTCIHLKKEVISKDENQETTNIKYYINNGLYSGFSTLAFKTNSSIPVPKVVAMKGTIDKMVPSSIFGPTCDSLDKIMDNVLLPVMNVEDYIVFGNMGAYTLTTASIFNGFPVGKVHIFVDENLWMNLKDMLPHIKQSYIFTNMPGNVVIGLHSAQHKELCSYTKLT